MPGAVVTNLFAGSLAGIASTLVCHPLDTIRTRLQTTDAGRFRGVRDVFAYTIKVRGTGGRARLLGRASLTA